MRIAIVSDTHLGDRAGPYIDNWRAVCAWAGTAGLDLIVHLGDISANGENDRGDLEIARAELAQSPVTVRSLPGNHDLGDNPAVAEGHATDTINADRLSAYRRVFGADRWSLNCAGWLILGLNAQLFGLDDAEEQAQWRWLEEQLSRGVGPVGLMLHKPLLLGDDKPAAQRYVPAASADRITALAKACDLRFVLSGHVHQGRLRTVEGVEHVWAPSAAFFIPDSLQERIGEKEVGVLLLQLEPAAHRFSFVMPEGVLRHNVVDHPDLYPALRDRIAEGRVP